ncbi:MAG: DUF3298 and DUF4163 domain-containing protein [Pelosinus sp.]|nr:DUF3298 and DUF4163 domain-containing protein [Pelosinus sp.]
MRSKIKSYVAAAIMAAVVLGTANNGWAMQKGPVDISQKKEQSERLTIFTPIITGLEDSDVEFNLNQMLASDAQRGLDKFLLKWNQMQKAAEQSALKSNFVADYSEKYNRNGILSITIQQYSNFNQGHSEKSVNAYTVDVNTGKVYNLFQIFRPFANFNSRLDDIIQKESALYHAKYSFKHVKDTQPFYLTEEGLVIYFQPGEIGAKGTDVIRFVIPYEMIRDLLNVELDV